VPMEHSCQGSTTHGRTSLRNNQTAAVLMSLLIYLPLMVGCGVGDEPTLSQVEKGLRQSLQGPINAAEMTVRRINHRLTVVLAERLVFDPGSDSISPKGLGVIKDIGAVLKKAPLMEIRVSGHTDSPVIIDRSREFFVSLASSKDRATHVVGILKETGVDPRALFIEWYGDIRPIASNGTEEGRQRNRRIEIAVSPWIPEPEDSSVLPGHAF
jgi:chemotaxis protein MotB